METKKINYRGGIVSFDLPSDWEDEYEEEGGGTFYKPGKNTGTLRLSIMDFKKSNSDELTKFKPLGYEWFRDDLFLKSTQNRFTEDGCDCFLKSWFIAYEVQGDHYRIAAFSYTVEEDLLLTPQTEEELSVVRNVIQNARFGKELGILENKDNKFNLRAQS